jgi:hypothetical protein
LLCQLPDEHGKSSSKAVTSTKIDHWLHKAKGKSIIKVPGILATNQRIQVTRVRGRAADQMDLLSLQGRLPEATLRESGLIS